MKPILGTANLFGSVDPERSEAVLVAAWDAGFRRFDTAPSYGFGDSEGAVGRLLAARRDADTLVTTKVGLIAGSAPGRSARGVKALARRLPRPVQDRLRRGRAAEQGRFSTAEVQVSIEQSLRRLGRIDRLMLHEVRPADITDELLTHLEGWQRRGDVGMLGVATTNERALACLHLGAQLFEGVHLAVGPFAAPVDVPPWLPTRVGHGSLGAGGADLRAVRARLAADPGLRTRWQRAAGSTDDDLTPSVGDALLARAARRADLTDVIVATSDPRRLPRAVATIREPARCAPALLDLLEEIVADPAGGT